MPLYEYECTRGHRFEVLEREAKDAPKHCNHPVGDNKTCDAPVKRAMSLPASQFPGAAGWKHG
ncbi:MAG: FmdB family zinc ribbon protein [Myxococcales bacterium]